MRLHLIAVGKRMPAWVREGFSEYNKRLPQELRLNLIEIRPTGRSRSGTTPAIIAGEAGRIRESLPKGSQVVALDEHGSQFDSVALARRIESWLHLGRDVALVIGGADGLDHDLKKSADLLWSLSPLTLPHAMTRLIVAEQIYRAWTILQKHPYHRV
jgi:rRNA large subunit m3Psi methyltransferase RlmH